MIGHSFDAGLLTRRGIRRARCGARTADARAGTSGTTARRRAWPRFGRAAVPPDWCWRSAFRRLRHVHGVHAGVFRHGRLDGPKCGLRHFTRQCACCPHRCRKSRIESRDVPRRDTCSIFMSCRLGDAVPVPVASRSVHQHRRRRHRHLVQAVRLMRSSSTRAERSGVRAISTFTMFFEIGTARGALVLGTWRRQLKAHASLRLARTFCGVGLVVLCEVAVPVLAAHIHVTVSIR